MSGILAAILEYAGQLLLKWALGALASGLARKHDPEVAQAKLVETASRAVAKAAGAQTVAVYKVAELTDDGVKKLLDEGGA